MSLINAAALRAAIAKGLKPVMIDVRWSLADGADRAAYTAEHPPGAVFLDVDTDLCGPPGPQGRHPLPDPDALQRALRAAGVDNDSHIVVYDGGDMLAAGRAWWTLSWAGLSVGALDGGLPAWIAVGGPVTADVSTPRPGTVTVRPGGVPVLDADGAAAWAADKTLVDVRAAARFRGEVEPIDPVAGHIPGAINRPDTDLLAPDGGFVDKGTLREALADLGDDVAVYCGSGITAARAALALSAVGRPTPPVYIGSWSGWIASGDRPVATGDV